MITVGDRYRPRYLACAKRSRVSSHFSHAEVYHLQIFKLSREVSRKDSQQYSLTSDLARHKLHQNTHPTPLSLLSYVSNGSSRGLPSSRADACWDCRLSSLILSTTYLFWQKTHKILKPASVKLRTLIRSDPQQLHA